MPEATKFKNGGIDPELENKLDWMFQGINDDVTFTPTFGLPSIDGTDDDEPPKVEVEEVVAVEDIQMSKKAMGEHFNEMDNHCMEQNPQAHSESEHQSEPPHQKKRSPEQKHEEQDSVCDIFNLVSDSLPYTSSQSLDQAKPH
ncbi:hypothetical protein GOBAR_DD11913 [Gossypium barbadense]|nr:hypothetical protein GOBAR_DD11913 [Gossypium barbadense]